MKSSIDTTIEQHHITIIKYTDVERKLSIKSNDNGL